MADKPSYSESETDRPASQRRYPPPMMLLRCQRDPPGSFLESQSNDHCLTVEPARARPSNVEPLVPENGFLTKAAANLHDLIYNPPIVPAALQLATNVAVRLFGSTGETRYALVFYPAGDFDAAFTVVRSGSLEEARNLQMLVRLARNGHAEAEEKLRQAEWLCLADVTTAGKPYDCIYDRGCLFIHRTDSGALVDGEK